MPFSPVGQRDLLQMRSFGVAQQIVLLPALIHSPHVMAEIRIQSKKSSPSPWLLVLLAGVLVALAAYVFLRPDPVDNAAPAGAPSPTASATPQASDSLADVPATMKAPGAASAAPDSGSIAGPQTAMPVTASELAAYAATDAAAPNYARRGLQQLVATLVDLADRSDLQDPAIQEQRNNLTSATARLSEDATASLRPGFVAAASLLRAIQQKAYPEQETAATQLQLFAGQLSGRTATAADQQQVRKFLSGAASLLEPLSQAPAAG